MFCAFADFHESGRIGPQTRFRFNRTPAEQDFPVPFRDASRHDLGIMIVNSLAGIADEPGEIVALRDFLRDGFTALTAELHSRHASEKGSAHG